MNRTRILIQLLVLTGFTFSGLTAHAHEFWLEPTRFEIPVGGTIKADIVVGQNFKGKKHCYSPPYFDRFTISSQQQAAKVESNPGDIPAVNQQADEDGLHMLAYISTSSSLTYNDPGMFEDFLAYEGLEWVMAEHRKRGLPEVGFKEAYRRYAKCLVRVGSGKGADKVLGLPLEWVVETNPYTTRNDIKATLYWQGKPLPKAHVNVFNEYRDGVSRTAYQTNEKGRVVIRRGNGGKFLVNAVHMIEPKPATPRESDAAWESLWASTTFFAPK